MGKVGGGIYPDGAFLMFLRFVYILCSTHICFIWLFFERRMEMGGSATGERVLLSLVLFYFFDTLSSLFLSFLPYLLYLIHLLGCIAQQITSPFSSINCIYFLFPPFSLFVAVFRWAEAIE